MKRLIAYAFALIITCAPTALVQAQKARRAKPVANQAANLSAQQIAKRVLPSVGLLICDNGTDAVQASGFFISPGLLVTNYHVIEGNQRGVVRLTVGKTRQNFTITRILGFDKESDLALLSVPDAAKANVPIVPLLPAGQWPEVGETVYALGNPEGLAGTISPGIVSAGLRSTKKQARLQITAPISHGSSGGPVVNGKGEVVGVAVGSLTEGQNLNFAVPTALIQALLVDTPSVANAANDTVIDRSRGWLTSLQRAAVTTASTPCPTPTPPPSIIGKVRPGESDGTASLRGLPGVNVTEVGLDDDLLKLFSAEQLKTRVELRLRRNGIRVLTEEESFKVPGFPKLSLDIRGVYNVVYQNSGIYSYSVRLELIQLVKLWRDPNFFRLASTWDTETFEAAGSGIAQSKIQEAIDSVVDEFCNDFLDANQKP